MKRALIPLLFALSPLLLLPRASRAEELRCEVPYTRFTLGNGLEVLLHVDRTTPRVAVNTWYHVGSGNERPGRTGFAHLFEHLMFTGSKNVPSGKFDEWLEAAGAENNGSTNPDRTNYFEDLPRNALELALFLDSDRMATLGQAMTLTAVDAQRDVVKNERRQSYENRPYGMAGIVLDRNLYPAGHPYSWPTIGSMADLSAASFEDVARFFQTYYTPNNASLSIAGDIDPEKTRALVEKWFGPIPRGPEPPLIDAPPARLTEEKRLAFEDRVQLPRLYLTWLSPAHFAPGDAALDILSSILTGGKNSRLYRRLVYEMQIAQDVFSYQDSQRLISSFNIVCTARAGHGLAEIEKVIQEEIDRVKREYPERRDLERAVNQTETAFLSSLERIGGFGGKADALNSYFVTTGDPDYFNEDLGRYRRIDPDDISACARTWLRDDARVVLSVVPQGKKELASGGTFITVEGM